MALRYQRLFPFAEQRGVATFEGVDPLTGLPVLIYEFEGEPAQALRDLESENIPGVLDVVVDGSRGQVVAAYSKGYRPIEKPLQIAFSTLLLNTAKALRDAAEAGIIHGDIRPEHFLSSANHVLIEGFGIPWKAALNPYYPQGEPLSLKADIFAWARVLIELGEGSMGGAADIFKRCTSAKAEERPSAEELYAMVLRLETKKSFEDFELPISEPNLATRSEPVMTKPAVPVQVKAPADDFDIDFDIEPEQREPKVVIGNPFMGSDAASRVEAKPTLRGTLSSANASDTLKAKPVNENKQTFVKNLPPGATYRPGSATVPGRTVPIIEETTESAIEKKKPMSPTTRRIVLLLVTVVLLALFGMLWAFYRQGSATLQTTQPEAARYLIEMQIEPANLPPIEIYVVSSPAGSRHAANSILGSYPPGRRQVVLDQEGLWQLQGRFQDRSSEVVSFQLPEQRNIVITIPEPPEPSEEEEN